MDQEETESLTLEISGFAAQCYIGVREIEKVCRQKVVVDVRIGLEPETRGGAPQIDYDRVCDALRRLFGEERFGLLEELTDRIAKLLREDFGAQRYRVRCTKPHVHSGVEGIAVVRSRSWRAC